MTREYKYVEVVLPLPLMQSFTYYLPDHVTGNVMEGVRVIVPFGKKKFYSGVVLSCHNNEPAEDIEMKEIHSILDKKPIITGRQFEFWRWISTYYHSSLGEVMKAALPSGLKLESETKVVFNELFIETPQTQLSGTESLIFRLLQSEKVMTVQAINVALQNNSAHRHIKSMLAKDAIIVEEKLKQSYKQKSELVFRLHEKWCSEKGIEVAEQFVKSSSKQKQLLYHYLNKCNFFKEFAAPSYSKRELLNGNDFSDAILTGLVKKGIFVKEDRIIDRIKDGGEATQEQFPLSPAQTVAYKQILKSFHQLPVALLHGVTSSGKTEIYIKLIESCLSTGKQALFLLPEIGLTTQMITRLRRVFGDKVGVYHSKFNDSERVEIWNKVLDYKPGADNNSHQVILGARSAVFLPFQNLGLIVVDEEHENSYKQFDPSPRYHARDTAIVLGHLQKAKVLLGTATPSVETYFNAKSGKYNLIELFERYKQIELPEIVTADTKVAYKRRQMKANFTPLLLKEMEEALDENKQIILFQNRRGYSPFIECPACAWIPKCQDCDVSLTFHKYNNTLSCHYCGYTQKNPDHCPKCGNEEVKTKGFGTEKIEADVQELFPKAKVARMDLDTTRGKTGYEKIITRFDEGKVDILIGTQMVTKGLDFENVKVVGILNADNLLNYPDFRSFERSYQLMAQVAGRAGRKHGQGKVVIQTAEPDHTVIQYVKTNDYQSLYQSQIEERRMFNYPPFHRMVMISIRHKKKEDVDRISNEVAYGMRQSFGNRVLGPEYPAVNRIQTWYIKRIWLKFERELSITKAKERMQAILDFVKNREGNKSVQFVIDMDPM